MKISVILENQPTAGGAFTQAINSIRQLDRLSSGRYELEIVTTCRENVARLAQLGLEAIYIEISPLDRILGSLTLIPVWQWLQRWCWIRSPFEKSLVRRGTDIAVFMTQSPSAWFLSHLSFITTVHDLAHREYPEFLEVGASEIYFFREHHFRHNLGRAVAVITASEELSEAISNLYGVRKERLLAMPFSVTESLSDGCSTPLAEVLETWQLREGYFFYPAQFWPHKNHIRIIEALLHLRDAGICVQVVFAGGDHGNRTLVEQFAARHSIADQVRILGFVPVEHMRGLYQGCSTVVMPTYFGPTNLPPIEAWSLGKPLIYSAHLNKDGGDAALYADPDDAYSLAEAMKTSLDQDVRAYLIAAGKVRIQMLHGQRNSAEEVLGNLLVRFAARRKCVP